MSDKITPEQLRKEAVAVERMHGETLTVDWRTKQADQLRAHAAAMTYTAWDYRKLAEYHEQLGNAIIAKHYLAHADTLEENARLRAAIEGRQAKSYTAEQLRAKARNLRELGRQLAADDCEAHADALEENTRLTRECEFHAKQCARVDELRHRAEAELAKLRQAIELAARAMGGEGVNDQGEAWDKCLRILDAARAAYPKEADK